MIAANGLETCQPDGSTHWLGPTEAIDHLDLHEIEAVRLHVHARHRYVAAAGDVADLVAAGAGVHVGELVMHVQAQNHLRRSHVHDALLIVLLFEPRDDCRVEIAPRLVISDRESGIGVDMIVDLVRKRPLKFKRF
jgi:hypothetical protein